MDTHEIGGSGRDHQSRTHTRKTDFSIESLLKKDPEPKLTENNKLFVEPREEGDLPMPFSEKTRREYESDQNSSSSASPEPIHPIMVGNDNHRFLGLTEEDLTTFSWLSCTRFKPPKLPRSRKRVGCKRYGRGPRIPFAPHQIAVLESTFSKSQYLSSDCIHSLADTLHLSETRVKIWFQNRRARYRREKEAALTQTTGDDGAHHHHSINPLSIQQYQQSDDIAVKQPLDLGRAMNELTYAQFMKARSTPEDLSNLKEKMAVVPNFLSQQLQHYRQVQEYIFQQERMRCNSEGTAHSQGNYSSHVKPLSPGSSILQSVLQSSSTSELFPGVPFQAKRFSNPESPESQHTPAAATMSDSSSSSTSHRFMQLHPTYPPQLYQTLALQFR